MTFGVHPCTQQKIHKGGKQSMKKILSCTFAGTILLAAMLIPVQAEPAQYKAAYGTPVVDGILDDLYKNSDKYTITFGKDGAESYSTAEVYWLWDEDKLYYYADVTDDTPSTNVNTSNIGDIWKTDCVEFGFNVTPDKESGDPHKTANSAVYLAAIGYGEAMDIYGALPEIASVKEGSFCAAVETDKGWALEIELPIFNDETGLSAAAGNIIAMYTILHNDTDNDNVRNSETYSNADAVGCQYDSNKMDKVVLQEKPVVEEVAETVADAPEATETVTAPQTMDAVVALGAAMALAGFGMSKKRK